MPVESRHLQWKKSIYAWQKSRDCMGGEKFIKSKNTKYLDMPTGMIGLTVSPSIGGAGTEQTNIYGDISEYDDRAYDPTWHSNPAYRAYLRRAKFPDLCAFTVRGLIGLATKRSYDLELPSTLSYLEDNFTKDGKTLEEFYKFALNEVFQTGRLACAIDIVDGKLTVVPYVAESNTNWKSGHYYVFEEIVMSGDDIFLQEPETVYRVMFLDDVTGIFLSSIQKKGDEEFTIPDTIPSFKGKTLTSIPVVVIGSTNLDDDVDQIPIEGISDCALQIYKKSADLSNSQYMSCNPTLVGIGVGDEDKPTALGSTVVWLIGNSDAKVDYTKTDTGALSHVKEDINDLFDEAANYGARLLGSPKRAAEAAESIRLQQTAGGATLESVVDTVSMGIESLIEIMADWSGATGDVLFRGSKEFSDLTLTAPERKELRESWMSGGISQETYLWNMKRSGILPEDRDIDDEMDLIDLSSNGTNLPDENDLPKLVVDNTEDSNPEAG